MFDDLFKKFPEIVRMLVQKASESKNINDSDEAKIARNKLLYQIKCATEEMDRLSNIDGERLSQEQIESIFKMPRQLPEQFKWKIQPRGKKR